MNDRALGGAQQKHPPLRPCLQVLNGIEWGRIEVLPVRPEPLILGRAESCDIAVLSPDVSRRHLRLDIAVGSQPMVRDLGSSNGTFVNNHRVEESPLQHNDILQVGRHLVLRFCYQEDHNIQQFKSLHGYLSHDGLTGLVNRKEVLCLLERELSFVCRTHSPVSFAVLDVDDFREVNESYGHHLGDSVLLELANRMRSFTRREEVLARFGGEEFALLPREADEEGIRAQAERIRLAVCEKPLAVGELELPLTISIGIAFCPPDHVAAVTVAELVELAEAQLRQAKSSGKNQLAAHQWAPGLE